MPILIFCSVILPDFAWIEIFQVSAHGCFADLFGDLPHVKIFLCFVSALPLSLFSAVSVDSSIAIITSVDVDCT